MVQILKLQACRLPYYPEPYITYQTPTNQMTGVMSKWSNINQDGLEVGIHGGSNILWKLHDFCRLQKGN